jgi:hypothetical protein
MEQGNAFLTRRRLSWLPKDTRALPHAPAYSGRGPPAVDRLSAPHLGLRGAPMLMLLDRQRQRRGLGSTTRSIAASFPCWVGVGVGCKDEP